MPSASSTSSATSVVSAAPSGGGGGGGGGSSGGEISVFIDGNDVSGCALTGSSTRRLNLPSQATVTLPMDCAIGGVGSRLKIAFNGTLHHHGRVLNVEDDTGEDTGTTVYNSTDPMEMWLWRPARDGVASDTQGNFIDPSFVQRNLTGPAMLNEILVQSIDGSDQAKGEGTLFLSFGGFAGGGVNLTGIPTAWPMTIAEVASLLVSTGEVDIVITPIDSGGNMGQVDVYNGNYGTNRTGSVVLEYGMGARNVRRLRRNEDMTEMVNKLFYFSTPRRGNRRFVYNVQGDDPGLPDPPASTVLALRTASRASYGVRMENKIFERGEDIPAGVTSFYRALDRRLWLIEQWIRAQPRSMVHVTPTRNTYIGAFDIGDLITVQASADVRGGFSGVQRVYEYTIGWDSPDGPLELSEIGASANAEGI